MPVANPIHFEFLGMNLQEPMALVTNGMISIFAFLCYLKVKNAQESGPVVPRSAGLKNFFLILSISTLMGGLSHIFFQYTGLYLKYFAWLGGVFSMAYLVIGGLASIGKDSPAMKAVVLGSSTLFLVAAIALQSFEPVKIHGAVFLVGITLPIEVYAWRKGMAGSKWIVVAILAMIIPALIHTFDLNIHRWFNRDDLSHVIMAFTMLLFVRGVTARERVEELEPIQTDPHRERA